MTTATNSPRYSYGPRRLEPPAEALGVARGRATLGASVSGRELAPSLRKVRVTGRGMTRRFWLGTAIALGVLSWMTMLMFPARAMALEPGNTTAIVAVHGGGWYGGTPAKMDAVCADLDYDCFQPSYTLSGAAPFSKAYRDLRLVIADLRAQGYTRIVGIGASAGGNLVGTLASHGFLDAAVTLSAPTQLLVLKDWYRTQCTCWVVDQFAPTQTKKADASPALDTIEVPILIVHSQDETLIPAMQANRLAWVSTQDTQMMLPGTAHAMGTWSTVSPDVAAWIGELA